MTTIKTVYFAGSLFNQKDLLGNAFLAQSIEEQPGSTYRCILPQNCEPREKTSKSIRNEDLFLAGTCDLGLFNFDGSELDSGTVVEYMIAKFLDIPSVIIRSDFRKSGDDDKFPWNLMLSNFPRTAVVSINSIAAYKEAYEQLQSSNSKTEKPEPFNSTKSAFRAGQLLSQVLARQVIEKLDQVWSEPSVLKNELLPNIYQWFRHFPGADFEKVFSAKAMQAAVERRIDAKKQ